MKTVNIKAFSLMLKEELVLRKVICPVMSVDDKYRTLYGALMGVFNHIAQYAQSDLDREQFQQLLNAAMYGAGQSAGKRLVHVYKLKPNLEDALKLLLLFNNEAMAYLPKLKQIYAEIDEEEDVGFLTVKRDPWYDWYFKHLEGINCEECCSVYEFKGIIDELGGKLSIECIASLPRGDDFCRFRIKD